MTKVPPPMSRSLTTRPKDKPRSLKKKGNGSSLPKAGAKVVKKASESDDDSDEKPKKSAPVKKAPVKKADSEEDSDDSDAKPVTKKPVTKAPAKKAPVSDSEESSEEVVKAKPSAKVPAKKKADSEEEESDEEPKTQPKVVAKPSSTPTSDCKELFVKNLSWNSDENLLGEFFGKYGEVVNVKVLYDKMTGKARGLAFIEFASRDEAQAALDDAGNLNIDGRLVQVSFSDQKPDRSQQQGGNSYGNNNRDQGNRPQRSNFDGERHTAFVGNLGFKTNEQSVRKFFSDCGNVVDVRIAKNEEGRSKGFCHVDFDSNDAVEKAKSKAGQDLDGREIRVDSSTPRQGGGDRGGRGGRGGFRGGDRGGRGGRGGFRGGNPRNSGAIPRDGNRNAVQTFDDSD